MNRILKIWTTISLYSTTIEGSMLTNISFIFGILCFLTYLYWKLFHQPFDLFRDFSELGFEEAGRKSRNNLLKMNIINEMRKRRKVGKLPPSYPNGWFAILESKELKKGQVREVFALGLSLVAWRGESGTPYIADAYCPHLGAHLGVGGEVHGECIKCPFHSWTFDGEEDGKLSSIPYAEKIPEFVKINLWNICETNDWIFIWHHSEKIDPTWRVDEIDEINQNIWTYRGRSEIRVACHIQEIPENGADIAHLNVLHSDIVLMGDNPKESRWSWNFLKHVWYAKWEANQDPDRKHEGLLKVKHHILLFGWIPCFYISVDIHQIGPGIVILYVSSFLGKGVFVQSVTPIEPLLQCVIHRFYTSAWIMHPIAKFILDGETKQVSRDIRIWNRKTYMDKPILTKEDQTIKFFRRWYDQFYSKNDDNNYINRDGNANKLEF